MAEAIQEKRSEKEKDLSKSKFPPLVTSSEEAFPERRRLSLEDLGGGIDDGYGSTQWPNVGIGESYHVGGWAR